MRQVQVSELGRIRDEVDLDDPSALDGEPDDGDGPRTGDDDDPRVSVHDRRARVRGEASSAREDPSSDVVGTPDRFAISVRAEIGAEDDVWVEDIEQGCEVSGP
jgi:hypothetical protein